MISAQMFLRWRRGFVRGFLGRLAAAASAVAVFGGAAFAGQWPTYLHDNARSGVTSEALAHPLDCQWVFRAPHAPEPAWGDPKPEPVEGYLELRRVHFDDAYQAVAADGRVFFGASGDGKVYCLDEKTGEVRWSYSTAAPIRLAPALAGGRVYFGSDDGYAYCLDAADGSLRWRFRAAPEDNRVLGHGRMISLWPLRGGVLVDDGVAYLASGIFPGEGVFFYALDAETGKEIWRNDTCGEDPQSRISPQGYLLASKSTLYAPMGRVSPAAFDRTDGKLKFFTYFGKAVGGTYALLAGEDVFTGTEAMVGFRGATRDRFAAFSGRKLVITEAVAYVAEEATLAALDRKRFPQASSRVESLRTRKTAADQEASRTPNDKNKALARQLAADLAAAEKDLAATRVWEIDSRANESLILAGKTVYAGGPEEILAVDAERGTVVWKAKVDGVVKGLAVAGGRLLVSTDKGLIYSFGEAKRERPAEVTVTAKEGVFAGAANEELFRQAAEEIVKKTGVSKGFCLLVGLETGQLAVELAKRTELQIYAVDEDAATAGRARAAIDAAGLLGSRIQVESFPLNEIPYSDYFANLIVSESVLAGETLAAGEAIDPDKVLRMLKPLGGTVFVRFPKESAGGAEVFRKWVEGSKIGPNLSVSQDGAWLKIVRGAIPGAGKWTHLYADSGNSACSDDRAVTTPLGVLWFGHPGPGNMVSRHSRAAGPLAIDGRLLVEGENVVMAYDMYNGLKLWERQIQGAIRVNASHDGGNLTANREGFFVAIGNHCLRLDAASGATLAEYGLPPSSDNASQRWGYIASTDDLLYGSRVSGTYLSDRVFAVDFRTGKHRWCYEGRRIGNNTIAIGDGTAYLIDSNITDQEQAEAIAASRARVAELPPEQRAAAEKALEKPEIRILVALDAATGAVRWKQPIDVTHCGGGTLSLVYSGGSLVVFGVYLDGHYWKEFFAGQFDSRRVSVFNAADGSFRWSRAVGYRVRPVVIGNTLHTEPWAYDLQTGQERTRINPITGQTDRWQFARVGHHCGLPIGSPNCLFFRSYTLGYYDLARDDGTMHFGAQRPGCWINFLPAGGLVLMPEASAGCMCPFPNMCSVAFQPREQNKAYTHYSSPGLATPVRRLALNLGAAGDRSDSQGNLWLALKRPFEGRLVLGLDAETTFYPGGEFVRGNSWYTPIEGTSESWLFTSAAKGLRKLRVPLLGKADGTALFQVRLGFCDPDNDKPGRRVFDVKLQGKTVLENFDPAAAAGGRNRAVVRQIDGVEVTGDLVLELVAKTPSAAPDQTPILQTIEILRQEISRLGCATPEVILSDREPVKTAEIALTNLRDTDFRGTLGVTAPEGLSAELKSPLVEIASGGRLVAPITLAVAKGAAAGHFAVGVELVDRSGKVELRRSIPVEHLGRFERSVVEASEDATVLASSPDANKGDATVLLVDGGADQMGDASHAEALFRFRLNVAGKIVRASLQIHNAGNPSSDAGRICLVEGPWTENQVTYRNRPSVGREVARLGKIAENEIVVRELDIDLTGKQAISLVFDPTGCDGIDYLARESGKPPALILEYEPARTGK